MKNLKKVLALALSATMALSMFVSAGAAYTDAADIKALGAVDMLTALGVINGNPDGSFKPDGTVTRAEMAKMIFTVRNGGNSDATGYESMPSTFTDIKTHWAAGYIKYCQSIGIIAGKSATKFAPDELVTGSEAAKMLLVCAGYTADKAGLIGSTWENKTLALATENELLLDVNSPVSSGLPRQYAAQIVYNALDMETVVYSKDIEGFKPAGDVSDRSTVGRKYMNLVKAEAGMLKAVNKVDGKDYYTITVGGSSKYSATSYTKVPTDVSSLIGQNIKVLVKDKTTGSDVYGVYADEDSKVLATGFIGSFEKDGDNVKLNGTSYKTNGTNTNLAVYTMNKDTSVKASDLFNKTTANDVAAAIKLIDNDGDGKANVAVTTPVKFGKVTSVGKTSITINNGVGTVKFDDAKIYEGVAKDDFVLFTEKDQSADDKKIVTKLDVTNDKVAATRSTTDPKKLEVKLGDTWYKLASDKFDANLDTGSTYDFVKVGTYILSADEAAASAKDIMFISARGNKDGITGETTTNVKVRAYFQDGTNKEVSISKVDGKKIANKADDTNPDRVQPEAIVADKLYTFSLLSDGTYDIKVMSDPNNKAGYDKVATATAPAYKDQKIAGYTLDDAAVFVKTQDEVKVLSGKQIKSWADGSLDFSAMYATKASNGINYIRVASLVSTSIPKVPGATKDTKYGYLTADPYQSTQNGEKKATYEVWTSEGAKTLYADQSSDNTGLKAGSIMAYSVNGSYIDTKSVDVKKVAITGLEDKDKGSVSFMVADNSTWQYDMDEDCVVFAIKDADKEGMEGGRGDVQLAKQGTDNNTVMTNAYVVLSTKADGSNDKVVAVIYDNDKNETRAAITYKTK